jgi:aminomethyltransferase
MFDLSHMGQLELRGEAVAQWLDTLTCNAVESMRPNQARYNVFTNESGGAHDDAIIYRLPERWLVIVNASNTPKMWAWLNSGAAAKPSDAILTDRTSQHALIALQGPKSAELLSRLTAAPLESLRYYYATEGAVCGVPGEIARTGYTGEDGFELFIAAEAAAGLWDRLMLEGRRVGLLPAGLGARDVLRLEAGMPLYGHELDEDISPLQAGLEWAVKLEKEAFIGKQALAEQRRRGDYHRIAGLIMEGKAPARAGYGVQFEGRPAGRICSGSPSPSLGGKNIATALLAPGAAALGNTVEVEIRGQLHPATIVPLPFYKRPR